ncbi:hypothetical protein H0E84_18560 [Luteimonas sp. SJ-92]|uniref:Uncharacterized protein n=1 Tax=Luteimonas salinisoli TaxID=2752307 RepID=A0A853JI43_9GAMM|nr:hypothetical protein [Luteimonas salinisoli]NZA28382.1 hypothetical protein [Luteimonas salinisoli]
MFKLYPQPAVSSQILRQRTFSPILRHRSGWRKANVKTLCMPDEDAQSGEPLRPEGGRRVRPPAQHRDEGGVDVADEGD